MSKCRKHNVRFYEPEPAAIYCMALQKSSSRLAVSRSDASLELWNLENALLIEKTIAPQPDNYSIEGLVWSGNRLFSVGLHGLLIEYDLHSLSIRNRSAVTGVAAHCLDVNRDNTHIAVGTEQGYLNLVRLTEDGVMFEKFLDKQEGRILSLKFDSTGDFIVAGSIDAIRIWNVSSGHAIHRMTLGKSEANKPTIVWSLAVTSDFTIISGDSRGMLTFWDGKMGARTEEYQSHKADILTICLSEDETSLHCAGADPTIMNYVRIKVKGEVHKWVKSIQRRIHDHDVRALAIWNGKLFSGGIDGYLACSFHPPKTLIKIPPILQNSFCYVASEARYLLLRYTKHLELWKLGVAEEKNEKYTGLLKVENQPQKLLVLQRTTKNIEGEEDQESIICCNVSNDGKWIAYSSKSGLRLFQITWDFDDKLNLVKISDLENSDKPCLQMVFSPDSSELITTQKNGNLAVYTLLSDRASISQVIQTQTDIYDTITFLTISKCGRYLIAGDTCSNIVIWMNKNSLWARHCKIPKYTVPPTALGIQPNTLNLVVVYADGKIIEYSIKQRELTPFSRTLQNDTLIQSRSKYYPIRNVTFDPRNNNVIILHDDSNIIVINKEKKASMVQKKSKLPKIAVAENDTKDKTDHVVKIIKNQKHLAYFSWISNDEVLSVEVNPLRLIEQLPPAIVQHTFGKK